MDRISQKLQSGEILAHLYTTYISTNEKPENKFDSGWYTEGQVEYQLETNWLKGAKFANFRPISKFEG